MASKNRGNKYFRGGRYELAIKCYSEAISSCPKDKKADLSTFYQNRAAAHEQLDDAEASLSDCNEAIKLNNRYVKALERRARLNRKLRDLDSGKDRLERLRTALEDMTSVCFLEGFQKQDHLVLVDTILKDLGRSEARIIFSERKPVLTSQHFIKQYFMSFSSDPVINGLKNRLEMGHSGSYNKIMQLLKSEEFQQVFDIIEDTVSGSGDSTQFELSRLKSVRATFQILSKQLTKAMESLSEIINDQDVEPGIRANCLIKRASLYIQRCLDPDQDAKLSFQDFQMALDLDPDNPDVYHHKGQVNLLTENIADAIQDFGKAVSLNPEFPISCVQKLYTEYRAAMESGNQVKIGNVMNSFEEAVSKYPDCVETYALYAQILCDQSQFERAEDFYLKATEVDPSNANLYVHRALVALQSRGDVVKGRELINKAIQIDDKCEFAYETLGTIEVQSGNLKAAVDLFEKAIPLANTELEMAHVCGLRSAAKAQNVVSDRLGIQLPSMMS